MASYRVGIKRSAGKELEELALKERRRVVERVRALADDPRPRQAEKLSGEDKYRIRQGNLRILYEVDDRQLEVTVVRSATAETCIDSGPRPLADHDQVLAGAGGADVHELGEALV